MKAPKNFYNTVDQKKLGIDQIEDIKNKVDSIISLPEATSSDEGKVALVNSSGNWELGTITSSNTMYFNITISGSSVTIADGVTKEDIYGYIKAGKNVILREVIDVAMGVDTYRYYYFMDSQASEIEQFQILTIDHITFTCIDDSTGTILRRCVKLGSSNIYEEFNTPYRYIGTAHWEPGDTLAVISIGHNLSNAIIDVYTSIYGLVPTDVSLVSGGVGTHNVQVEFDTDEEFDIKVVATV